MVVNAAGTMDVSTHTTGEAYKMKTRVQKSGQTLNVEVSYHFSEICRHRPGHSLGGKIKEHEMKNGKSNFGFSYI